MIGFDVVSLLLGGLLALTTPPAPPADERPAGLLTRRVTVGTTSHSYQVYVPESAPRGEKLPVILFLHGIGQRGEGGFVPTGGAGAGALIKSYMEKVPAIVVLPQCQRNRYWSDPDMEQMALAATDQAAQEFGGDPERIYLIGVSMGGYGAWHLASEAPGKFAAIIPICGGSPRRDSDRFAPVARRIGQTPAWVFHGADDRVVPVSESRQMVAALKAVDGNVRYSEYAGVGHNVWLRVLGEPKLLPWMFAQRLTKS